MSSEKIKTVCESINGQTGGEAVLLVAELFDNGDAAKGLDAGFFTNLTIETVCHGSHSSSISVYSSNLDSIIYACMELKNKLEKAKFDYLKQKSLVPEL